MARISQLTPSLSFAPASHAYVFGYEGHWQEPGEGMVEWTIQTFGEGPNIHETEYDDFMRARWCYSAISGFFWFHNGDDALVFKLRWC